MGLRDRLVDNQSADGVDGIGYYRKRLLDEVDLSEFATLSDAQRRARLERVVGRMVSREGPVLSTAERTRLIRRVIDEAIGLGVLEPLLADPTVTEIMVNGLEDIFVERDGRIQRSDISFNDEAQLYQTIDRIVSQVNRRVDESSPMVDARLPTGERVNVIIPPLALHGPTITIRRFPRLFTLEQLVRNGSIDADVVEMLRACVRAKLNIVISGGTGAGKTTLLNALSAAVPPGERIITVEDNAELRLQQPHVVTLEARPPNVEGRGEVSIRDLVRNSLRMRPDRIIVGEVRGGETLDMLQALNTGHEGSLVTVHANSCDDAIHRMETLATMSDLHIPFEALRDQINSAIHVIVQIDRYADGRRRVGEVAAVASRAARGVPAGHARALRRRPPGAEPARHGSRAALPAAAGHPALDRARRARRCPRSSRRRPPPRRCGRPSDGQGRPGPDAAGRRAARRAGRHRRSTSAAPPAAPSWPRAAPLDPGETGWRRLRRRLDRQLRRTRTGQRLDRWLSSAGTKIAAIDLRARRPRPHAAGRDPAAARCSRAGSRSWSGPSSSPAAPASTSSGCGASAATRSSPSCPTSRACSPTARPPGSRCPAAVQLAARELPEPAAAEMRSVVEQLRVGQPVEDALESLRERLPSRELGVLMTTLVIQQRAGGDTVRALNELSGTLDARKDLLREIRTLLSGAVYTSYVVAGIGVGAIVLLNFIAPGVMREMTTTLPGLVALVVSGTLWGVAFVLIRRTTRVEV